MERNKKTILAFIILLIVLLGAFVWYKKFYNRYTRENVEIKQADLNAENPVAKVPENFPRDIPLQLDEVTESLSMHYTERNVMLSGITFKTYRSVVELFNTYKGFMEASGYILHEEYTTEEGGVVYGMKDGNTLMAVINLGTGEDGSTVPARHVA